jgi:hypothetical protein
MGKVQVVLAALAVHIVVQTKQAAAGPQEALAALMAVQELKMAAQEVSMAEVALWVDLPLG